MIRRFLALFFLTAFAFGSTSPVLGAAMSSPTAATAMADEQREPVTILISIDGFRPDYLTRGITPNLNALAATGAMANMRSSFPTKTFPNHWTLVTGKAPDNHGIVGNTMEDPNRPGEVFKMATKDPFWWDQAEPIWSTAEAQGVRSATMFWPGSEVRWNDKRPSDWWPFSQDLSDDRRVAAVVDWLRRPAATRPTLITLYFDTVDTAGHFYGPGPSKKLHKAIKSIDDRIGDLVREAKALKQPVNYVIVSDHGMAETGPDRVIYLDNILPRDRYRLVVDGNYAGIEPLAGDNPDTIRAAFLKPHANMMCWAREDIPAKFQYGKNPRVPTILCLPDSGWVVYQDKPVWLTGIGGGHGYDQWHPDMMALFIASGPGIEKAGKIATFDNVAIYALVAKLIAIKPNQSDGDLSPFQKILKP